MSQDRFVRETREEIRRLSDGFVDLEVDDDAETVDEMFRTAHSLKGTLSMEGYTEASELAHAIEDVLEGVRDGDVDPEGEVIDAGLEATDTLQSMVTEVVRYDETGTDPDPLIEDLRALAGGRGRGEGSPDGADDDLVATAVAAADPEDDDEAEMSAEEALAAVSEFDDLDAVTERMDDVTEEFEDLEGGGTFDEVFGETDEAATADTEDAGAEEADVPFDDEEAVESGDAFIWIKEEVEEGDTSVDELQSEIESESFGEFDEEDDMSIQELLAIEPDESADQSPSDPPAESSAESAGPEPSGIEDLTTNVDLGGSAGEPAASDPEPDPAEPADQPDAPAAESGDRPDADATASGAAATDVPESGTTTAAADDERAALSAVLDAIGDAGSGAADAGGVEADTGGARSGPGGGTADAAGEQPAALSDVDLDAGGVDLDSASFSQETGTEELESRFEGLFGEGDDEETTSAVAPTFEASSLAAERFRRGSRDRLVAPERRPAEVQSLTVDVEYADELLSLAERLSMHTRELSRIADDDAVAETAEALRAATSDLQRTVMDVRLMPLERVTDGLDRVVRDVARETGTEATLDVEGSSIQLDRSIIDRIGDPIVHLVRNAVDHGIEDPDSREARGKPRTGTVTVRAERTGDDVVIEIEDDGSGVDVDAVREAAVEADVLDPAEARTLPDGEVLDLLFHPGLSTSGTVTETSGRGVGLDVVKRTVTALGGSVAVESTPGRGTLIRLQVPVSVVLAEVLFVEAGGRQYALPVEQVQRVGSAGESVTGGDLFGTTGADRTVDLAAAMGLRSRTDGDSAVVYLETGAERLAIECDAVLDRREVVITPYDDLLAEIPGVSGATTGGDGRLIHVLETDDL